MTSILNASNAFDQSINTYSEAQMRKDAQDYRRGDFGRCESRAYGALAMLGTLTASIALTVGAGPNMGATPADVTNAFIVAPVVAGVITYVAHQAAPFRKEIMGGIKSMADSVPSIGAGVSGAFARFGKALDGLGNMLNLSSGARALKKDAENIKQMLGVDDMKSVRFAASIVGGKENQKIYVYDALLLRKGIDMAVKEKLSSGDHTPLSYSDIDVGILKSLEKNKQLGTTIEESKGKLNLIDSVRKMMANPATFNDIPAGDYSSLKNDLAMNTLKKRDEDKGLDSGPK